MMKLGFMIGLKWMLQAGKISKELTNANGDDLIVSINSPVVMYTKGQKFIQH